ncbi:MAG: DUF4142 domain-containing protein [Cyclobacteriaceae bacterium]|nr:DUF4142 domain-containing protein [Cyclobacteriaceae bacterium]
MEKFRTSFLKATLIITVMIGALSCTDNKPKDAKVVAEKRNEERFDNRDKEKDAQFLVNAAAINMEKISLGQLAQQKGTNDHVKELGKTMETEHAKSHVELNALAKSKNVTLPAAQTQDSKDAHKKLNEKSGNDFGKAYSDMMVSTHKDAIKQYEKAASDSKDPDIRNWAQKSLPLLRTHLEHAEKCKEECAKI